MLVISISCRYFVIVNQRRLLNIILIIVAIGVFLYFQGQRSKGSGDKPRQEQKDNKNRPVPPSDGPQREEGLNRRATSLSYSKHARCRMDCRHIDESEVKEILANGQINQKKSEPGGRSPRYAVEGMTHDNQRVRIIFAQDAAETVVVTVIDLDKEWQCDCQ